LTVEARDAKRKLPAERHGELLAKAVEISQAEGLSAVTLRRVAADLGVTPSLVSQYFSAAEQLITAAFRAAAIAEIVRAGVADGEFRVADVEVTARRLLTMIDGLGAQKVVRGVPSDEAKHIAGAYFASELGVAD
jgi:AcrR family transcriptional regulator